MNLPQGWELILIVLVVVLLFGAKKLPEAARGIGRSLRIFKAEVKQPNDTVDESPTPATTPAATTPPAIGPAPAQPYQPYQAPAPTAEAAPIPDPAAPAPARQTLINGEPVREAERTER